MIDIEMPNSILVTSKEVTTPYNFYVVTYQYMGGYVTFTHEEAGKCEFFFGGKINENGITDYHSKFENPTLKTGVGIFKKFVEFAHLYANLAEVSVEFSGSTEEHDRIYSIMSRRLPYLTQLDKCNFVIIPTPKAA